MAKDHNGAALENTKTRIQEIKIFILLILKREEKKYLQTVLQPKCHAKFILSSPIHSC